MKKFIYLIFLCCVSVGFTKKNTPVKKSIEIQGIFFSNQPLLNSNDGKAVYQKFCLSCHQTDGSGVPGRYPPLKNNERINGNPERLIKIVLNGLEDEIEVNGEIYNQPMPPLNYLTDLQIANVLTYIRKNFGNNPKPVQETTVKALRKASIR